MARPIPGGFLLALEGIDGSGKSLQAAAVAAVLRARGLGCIVTHEPTRGPWGMRLRESARKGRLSPAEELQAFVEDRRAHVRDVIRPGLEAGQVIITDRYYFSTVAYQGARGLDPAELLRINEAFAPEPHLLVVIDLDAATGLSRIGRRGDTANYFESLAQLSRCREIFLSVQKPYLVRVDGRAGPDEIRDQILVAFSRAAVDIIASNANLTPREQLAAILALHGAAPAEGC
jgi:dTMP kinase